MSELNQEEFRRIAEDALAHMAEIERKRPKRNSNGDHSWYAVRCVGAPDKRVIECAERVGWKVYMPHCMELRTVPLRRLPPSQRKSGVPVKRPVPVPLFPRYPFLRFDLRDAMRHEVFQLLGVQGVICDGSSNHLQPAPMADEIIQAFMDIENGGNIPLGTTVQQLAFQIGEQVRISGGTFLGFNAIVDEVPNVALDKLDAAARIKVLISLFGRQVPVELSLADLEKI
jgi:transcription termination/antitermination protein NusG